MVVSNVDKKALTEAASDRLEPVIAAFRQQLGANLIAVVLFGSRARGDQRPDSDWDLLVVASQLPASVLQRHFYLKSLLPLDWAAKTSVLAKTPRELEENLTSLMLDIALDGEVLYDTDGYITNRLGRLQRLMDEKGLYREQAGRDLTWQWRDPPGRDWSIEWETENAG